MILNLINFFKVKQAITSRYNISPLLAYLAETMRPAACFGVRGLDSHSETGCNLYLFTYGYGLRWIHKVTIIIVTNNRQVNTCIIPTLQKKNRKQQ